jgi:hypothetical protein
MIKLTNLEAHELELLLEKIPLCLNFAIPLHSRQVLRSCIEGYTAEMRAFIASIPLAEHWERIAKIDQTVSDYEYAARLRSEANKAHLRISNCLSKLLNNLGSKEAASVARTAIICEVEAIKARGRLHATQSLSRFADFQSWIVAEDSSTLQIAEVHSPFYEILARSVDDKYFLTFFSEHHREFEIFIADCYKLAGWDKVELTPQRGDGGRDVIATRKDVGTIRILEQTKAYRPGRLVTHNDVRAMIGVLGIDHNASKGIITTTSDFQPLVMTSPEFAQFMPYRLELRNGAGLREWLSEIRTSPVSPPSR